MSDRLKALREKRGRIVKEMKDLVEKWETDDSNFDEEKRRHETLFDDQNKLKDQIEAEERQNNLDREEAEAEARRAASATRAGNAGIETAEAEDEGEMSPERRARRTNEYQNAYMSYLRYGYAGEHRATLQADNDIGGGYLVAPEQFVNRLIKFVDDQVFIRRRATTFSVPNADSLGAPSLDTDPGDADWTTELATGNEDTAMEFGKRELHPHPVAKRVKISRTLLRKATMGVEALVRQRLGYKFAITQEKAFLTGDGSQKPLGIYVASDQGIPTARDVSVGNTATEIKFDGLIEAKYSLKGAYWANAAWNFHRDALKQITKLKDGEGQYIWRPSVREGEPDRILGHPYDMSEYTPNTFATGQYVGCIGDFSWYWIADALSMTVQRLEELYAETNQVGLIGRMESDAMPVLAEAFARVKLA